MIAERRGSPHVPLQVFESYLEPKEIKLVGKVLDKHEPE